jgi:hypothetical protein
MYNQEPNQQTLIVNCATEENIWETSDSPQVPETGQTLKLMLAYRGMPPKGNTQRSYVIQNR